MSEALAWATDERVATLAARERRQPYEAALRQSSAASTSREVFPASSGAGDTYGPLLRWWPSLSRRVGELSELPEGWDSYGGSRLQAEPARALLALLTHLDAFIQSEPVVSLTGSGGLNCEWSSEAVHLELQVDPDGDTEVFFRDDGLGVEWEGPAVRCPQLEKWLWQASSAP